MPNKILYLFFVLVLCSSNAVAQNAIGIKITRSFSEFTTKNSLSVLKTKLGHDPSENADPRSGLGISTMLYFDLNKYFSVGLEPGIAVIKNYLLISNFETVHVDFTNAHTFYVESPIKVKLRLPISKDNTIGIYSSFGINPIKLAAGYLQENSFREKSIELSNTQIYNNWELKRIFGLGMDFRIKMSRIYIDLDLSSSVGFSPFSKSTNGEDFFEVFGLKEFELGVGYAWLF